MPISVCILIVESIFLRALATDISAVYQFDVAGAQSGLNGFIILLIDRITHVKKCGTVTVNK